MRHANTCVSGLKRTFMHVSGLPQPYSDFYFKVGFLKIKICWKKTWDMYKRAFQALKCTFIHVPSLPPPYFDKKPINL